MKLFAKYNRINVLSIVLIFLLGSFAFAYLLQYVIINQVDEDLKIEKNEIVTYVNSYNHLPNIIEVRDQYTKYQLADEHRLTADKIYTRQAYDSIEKEKELRRIIQFNVHANNVWYLVSVSKSLEGTDQLIKTIIVITITLILLILAATFIINRIVLRRLWKPFYGTLQSMRQFSLRDAKAPFFSQTDIDEFKLLNSILTDALNKAQQDYQTLKEFTENASHELQTPLAVIQSKLDLLIQSETLSESESETIQSAYKAVQNLSKLNQSLLLLAKIENKQFNNETDIDLNKLLQHKINQFSEIWKSRNLNVKTELAQREIKGNTYLVEILLNNLLSNATKHNMVNGSIHISLENALKITNTGVEDALDENRLFKRFTKQNDSVDNHGLGLSVVWQICLVSNYQCIYNFKAPNLHSFSVAW